MIGIGGAGMSAYALAAHALGAAVTGSDGARSPYSERLRDATGIHTLLGHRPENLPAGDGLEVCYSSAVAYENPERAAARSRGLRELSRGALLGEISALKRTIAIAGAHGKTTTACMVAHILSGCGMDPSYLIGGVLRSTGTNAAWGSGEWLVIEADESDRSMLELRPEIALVTNIELDHHATYRTFDELSEVFAAFLAKAPIAVLHDEPQLLALRHGESVLYSVEGLELHGGESSFSWRGEQVRLALAGAHNALNATGALEAARLAGAPQDAARRALASFSGAARRFELLGRSSAGALIYSDYAHHPTEVSATLQAARALTSGRLVAVFQPHLYSRTAALAGDFAAALAKADLVVVLDVYPARERREDWPQVSGALIARAVAERGVDVRFAPSLKDGQQTLEGLLVDGDLAMLMGAGDIDTLARTLTAA
jgi:UDP-N-acetylmuramate--alanine ligase